MDKKEPTKAALKLYYALKNKGVYDMELEKYDGYKHIDIAIVKAKINIEIDGSHHNLDEKQALSDIKRTYYSFKKGYFTIRIPNSLTNNEDTLNTATEYIKEIIQEGRKQKRKLVLTSKSTKINITNIIMYIRNIFKQRSKRNQFYKRRNVY